MELQINYSTFTSNNFAQKTGKPTIFCMKKVKSIPILLIFFTVTLLSFLFNGCFKDLPVKTIVYQNDFETNDSTGFKVYNANGIVDTPTIAQFNGSRVLGRFNNNFLYLKVKNLPEHSILKIAFDLLIHDKWDGDYIAPGNSLPDAWVMNLDNYPFILTTFSNGLYRQSYPDDYTAGGFKNPPKANAWETQLPGACSLQSSATGSSMYRIEKTTSHVQDSLVITMNDVLQPPGNYCLKSWSIDNLVISVNRY